MICLACREHRHEECEERRHRDADRPGPAGPGVVPGGRSWCDCQHRRIGPTPPQTGAPGE